jgi:hypothetical protein
MLPHERKIDGKLIARATAPAASDRHMEGRPGVAEVARVHGYRCTPTNHGPAALELVYGEIHPAEKKGAESPLHTILGHQPLQVSVLAANEVQ